MPKFAAVEVAAPSANNMVSSRREGADGFKRTAFRAQGLQMANNKLIYDVGAHKGEDTEFYLKKGFQVVAIEAVPEFCVLLEHRFAESVCAGQLKILNIAVSKSAGSADFYINEKNSVWGTANLDWVERNKLLGAGQTRKISVETRPLVDVFNEYGVPRYCKIDIEGSDVDALRSLVGYTDLPFYISIESEKRDWSRLMNEFLTLRQLGYSRYQIVDQSLINLQVCPQPAREGNDCDHIFQDGSSGLFGEELPGTWVALPEAIEAYRNIFRGYALNGDNGMFRGQYSIFRMVGEIQERIARLRNLTGYVSPAHLLPPAAWYDTHAAR
jgi:FkbM family methyltransferase